MGLEATGACGTGWYIASDAWWCSDIDLASLEWEQASREMPAGFKRDATHGGGLAIAGNGIDTFNGAPIRSRLQAQIRGMLQKAHSQKRRAQYSG